MFRFLSICNLVLFVSSFIVDAPAYSGSQFDTLDCGGRNYENVEKCEKQILNLDVDRNILLGRIDINNLSTRESKFVEEQEEKTYPTVPGRECILLHPGGLRREGSKGPTRQEWMEYRECTDKLTRDIAELRKSISRLTGIVQKQTEKGSRGNSSDKIIIIQ